MKDSKEIGDLIKSQVITQHHKHSNKVNIQIQVLVYPLSDTSHCFLLTRLYSHLLNFKPFFNDLDTAKYFSVDFELSCGELRTQSEKIELWILSYYLKMRVKKFYYQIILKLFVILYKNINCI